MASSKNLHQTSPDRDPSFYSHPQTPISKNTEIGLHQQIGGDNIGY